ncbi:MAG: hypothetical protein BWY20_02270 [Spirochaetes bacterium ADurb.Bin215]|nr:MAG: hypothetical protein BWY20_02270 [Spirochaetes bacterium ADurb.Bin215]
MVHENAVRKDGHVFLGNKGNLGETLLNMIPDLENFILGKVFLAKKILVYFKESNIVHLTHIEKEHRLKLSQPHFL